MSDVDPAVILILGIIATVVIGGVGGYYYGWGIGGLIAGIFLIVWMIFQLRLFGKDQDEFVQLGFGIASLISTIYGVTSVVQESSYSGYTGIFALVSAFIIVGFMVWIYLYLKK